MGTKVKSALCALALACLAAPAAALPIVSLDLDAGLAGIQASRTVALGDVFDVVVWIEGVAPAEALVGFQFALSFAATVLEPLAAVAGGFLLAPRVEVPSLGSGSVSLVAASQAAGAASGEGILALLTFEALAAGSTAVGFTTSILSAPLGVAVAHASVGGLVHVPEPASAVMLALAFVGARRRWASRAP